jgi:hypothetical protein
LFCRSLEKIVIVVTDFDLKLQTFYRMTATSGMMHEEFK